MKNEYLDVEVEMVEDKLPTFAAEKIDHTMDGANLTEISHVQPEDADTFKRVARAVVNEDSTDIIVEAVAGLMPWKLGWVARKALDRMLPDMRLGVLFRIVDRITS